MTDSLPDLDGLSCEEQLKLAAALAGDVARLQAKRASQREETARLERLLAKATERAEVKRRRKQKHR